MKRRSIFLLAALVVPQLDCSPNSTKSGTSGPQKPPAPEVNAASVTPPPPATIDGATEETVRANAKSTQGLPFADRQDFDDATKGLIAKLPEVVKRTDGKGDAWNLGDYAFIKPDAPPPSTVNPSLWRQAQVNSVDAGLFKVAEHVYQVRGLDLANMSIVEGKTGLIVIDTLTSQATGKAGLDLVRAHLGNKPIVAVIVTHSHVDHFGGMRSLVSDADARSGKVKVIAPEDFVEHSVSENVYAGTAMSRRSTYMYGAFLPKGVKGQVDAGLGKNVSNDAPTIVAPNVTVKKTNQTLTIDGVKMVFQYTPGTEAPTEMNVFFPEMRAICMAENVTHNLHNLYTLRGAEVRDAKAWSRYLGETLNLFGDKVDVMFASHHWPRWGGDRIREMISSQRDLYKYIHDQTLRLANHGYTSTEIAEKLTLPEGLQSKWYNRGYYGTMNHNAKAVYQRYLGWYDSNPAHLHQLPPQESGKRYVDFMGGSAQVVAKARESYRKGDYRWVAEVLSHVVFAEPNNQEAKNLEADALEQLGFQSESGPWRNEYLQGALELRHGIPKLPPATTASPDVVAALTTDMLFDALGIRLNGPKAASQHLKVNFSFPDTKEKYLVTLENGVLLYEKGKEDPSPDAAVTMSRKDLNGVAVGETTFQQAIAKGSAKCAGKQNALAQLDANLDTFGFWFGVVTPAGDDGQLRQ